MTKYKPPFDKYGKESSREEDEPSGEEDETDNSEAGDENEQEDERAPPVRTGARRGYGSRNDESRAKTRSDEPAEEYAQGTGDEDDIDVIGKTKVNFTMSNRLFKEAVLMFMDENHIEFRMDSAALAKLIRKLK